MYLNRAAKKILHIDNERIEGNNFKTVLQKRSEELVLLLEHALNEPTMPYEMEVNAFNDDGEIIPIGLTIVTLYDTDGSRRGIIINFKDLTEKIKLLEMVRQTDRMAAIGELSAAIAHEIKNPLASICSSVEMLADSVNHEDPHAAKLLQIIEKESGRLQRISSDFLNFARIRSPEMSSIELKSLVDDVIQLVHNDPRKTEDIAILNNIAENTKVLFDEDQLKQIILNLIINSLDALDGHGTIEFILDERKHIDKRYVRLLVKDTGPGFPKDSMGHMFEPFFSTKKEGTGLGLAIVRKMTVGNNGRILAQNRPAGGAELSLDILLEGAV